MATDPDCDRCGIAVRTADGGYQLLTGNEVGLLMLDYICSQRVAHGRMPANPVFVKTIVTMDLAEKIAAHYGVSTVNVLTGFKFIGEVIGRLEATGREADYICGFEESYGYLTGTYVRDKDGVNAAFMICEMFAFYKTRGISLLEKLEEIYKTYGYCLNTLHSYEFDGSAGMAKMQGIMDHMRKEFAGADACGSVGRSIGGLAIDTVEDYNRGLNGLPKSNVLKIKFDGGSSVVVRPSGTEPKVKVYVSVIANGREQAEEIEKRIAGKMESRITGEIEKRKILYEGGLQMKPILSFVVLEDCIKQKVTTMRGYVPVVLIKPESIYWFNKDYIIDRLFDYFDYRTDKIQFFLPGYTNSPEYDLSVEKGGDIPLFTKKHGFIELRMKRLGDIYYNNESFVEFVKKLEDESKTFRYFGDTELLFIKYDTENQCFDFSDIHRYNLSALLYNNVEHDYRYGLRVIRKFLEYTVYRFGEYIRYGGSAERMFNNIKDHYENL